MTRSRQATPLPASSGQGTGGKQTFLEHILELRARLFWIVLVVLATSSLGYVVKDQLIDVLMRPLGEQKLVYLTPIGGFSFIIKVSLYFGMLVAVPVIVYHLYRYLEPLMNNRRRRVTASYVLLSSLLAFAGVGFAYFVSLPAALHFLTNFNIQHISAMLTVDSYLSFVVTYLLGAALLFQIPLILLIIDGITPLGPSSLMKYQRHVILAAFVIAAMISPTPDMINQGLLALPIIGMYQIGVLLVWWQSWRRRRALPAKQVVSELPQPEPVQPMAPPASVATQITVAESPTVSPASVQPLRRAPRTISDFASPRGMARSTTRAVRPQPRPAARPNKVQAFSRPTPAARQPSQRRPAFGVDGFMIRGSQNA